jgi:hypothetical protein
MTFEPLGRSLSDFTVELDVYSGPYEWLLALILKDELEIFEIPLRELVESYLLARRPDAANAWSAIRISPAPPLPSSC